MSGGYVVVSGLPGSGKTTLARAMANELDLPLLSKDTIKEALGETLEVADLEASMALGRAAIAALIAVAVEARQGVIESSWNKPLALADLARLEGPIVEVFCSCPPRVAWERYVARAATRHTAHLDLERLDDPRWTDDQAMSAAGPLEGGWLLLRVDTTTSVDTAGLARAIRAGWGGVNRQDDEHTVVVRPARSSDIADLASLTRKWQAESITPGQQAEPESSFDKRRASHLFVAARNGHLVGYCAGSVSVSGQGTSAVLKVGTPYVEIEDLYVSPEQRSQGIGGRLLDAVLASAARDGIERSLLFTGAGDIDAVLRFYRRHGYEPWGLQLLR